MCCSGSSVECVRWWLYIFLPEAMEPDLCTGEGDDKARSLGEQSLKEGFTHARERAERLDSR